MLDLVNIRNRLDRVYVPFFQVYIEATTMQFVPSKSISDMMMIALQRGFEKRNFGLFTNCYLSNVSRETNHGTHELEARKALQCCYGICCTPF